MKTRGILLNGEMVRAVLDGSKTMARRPVAIPRRGAYVMFDLDDGWWPYASDDGESLLCSDGNEHPMACPFGVPGDRLYVKETFCRVDSREHEGGQWIDYRATPRWGENEPAGWPPESDDPGRAKWSPSVHMSESESRITLEVTDIRVERVEAAGWEWAVSFKRVEGAS